MLRLCGVRRCVRPSRLVGCVARHATFDFEVDAAAAAVKQDEKKIGLLALFLSEKPSDREADGTTRLRLSQSHWSARKIP